MMSTLFPRTVVGGVSLSRMIIGTNWILGYSHTGAAADKMISDRNNDRDKVCDIVSAYLEYGVDTMMAPFSTSTDSHPSLLDGIKAAEDRMGKKVIMVDTPAINVDNTNASRKEAQKAIENAKKIGSTFCLIHHSSAEQLVCKNTETIDRLPDYLKMIRDCDMIPGLSAHMPELVVYADQNEYDVETYIQLYNCMGFLMQVEVEYINKVIWNAKKPVMTIKPLAAGRTTPFVGLTFSYATIRQQDMVAVGAFTPEEVHEDVEIALAAIERRQANLEGRNSPSKTSIMK